jgi:chromosome partitioning protein
MPMAQEARKPIFHLTAADGALGAHAKAMQKARFEFEALATKIALRSWDAVRPNRA